jgi:hypothetical protein
MTITRVVVSICFPFPKSNGRHGAPVDHVAFTVPLLAAAIRSNFWPFCLNHIAHLKRSVMKSRRLMLNVGSLPPSSNDRSAGGRPHLSLPQRGTAVRLDRMAQDRASWRVVGGVSQRDLRIHGRPCKLADPRLTVCAAPMERSPGGHH